MNFLAIFVVLLAVFANIRVNAKVLICTFSNLVSARKDPTSFEPSDIDGPLCTHIRYTYAHLDAATMTIKSSNVQVDITNQFYQKAVAFKAQNLIVLLSIGGPIDSTRKYSDMMATAATRATFIASVVAFLQLHGFDGLDLDLEYPSCWQGSCDSSLPDKENYALLVKELNEALHPLSLYVTTTVPGDPFYLGLYNVTTISQYSDGIYLKAYDYVSSGKTRLNAPLYSTDLRSVDASVQMWLGAGAQLGQFVLGIPTHAESYTLTQASSNGLGASTNGPGNAGLFTATPGKLSFFEVMLYINWMGYNYKRNIRGGVYAYKDDQWFVFDDLDAVRSKAVYIYDQNIAGAMISAVDMDDFKNFQGCMKYPLLKAIHQVFVYGHLSKIKSSCFHKELSQLYNHRINLI